MKLTLTLALALSSITSASAGAQADYSLPTSICGNKIKQVLLKELNEIDSSPVIQIFSDLTKDGPQTIHVDDTEASSGEDLYVEFKVVTSGYDSHGDCQIISSENRGASR